MIERTRRKLDEAKFFYERLVKQQKRLVNDPRAFPRQLPQLSSGIHKRRDDRNTALELARDTTPIFGALGRRAL